MIQTTTMNKWFDTNLANYAKTALYEAQKRIDQVLDIKEDEILNKFKQQQALATASGASASVVGDGGLAKSSSGTSLNNDGSIQRNLSYSELSRSNQRHYKGDGDEGSNAGNEDFFSTFLGQNELTTAAVAAQIQRQESCDDEQVGLVNSNISELSSTTTTTSTTTIAKFQNEDEQSQQQQAEVQMQRSSQSDERDAVLFAEDKLIESHTEDTYDIPKGADERDGNDTMNDNVDKEEDEETEKPKMKPIDKEKQDWIQNYIDVNNENAEAAAADLAKHSGSNQQQFDDDKSITADYVMSGNASSNSDEPETCASSDIEVLSIPSLHHGPVPAHLHQMASNKNVILVKSPPALQQAQQQHSDADAVKDADVKLMLDTREAQIIKLNKQNVQLQEKNDNLLTEIDRLKFELQQKTSNSNYDDMTRKYAQTQLEKENLRKTTEQLNFELNSLRKELSEKSEQVEQLIQEGHKLSKNEFTQLNTIKKLRGKEKESEEQISSLKNELKKAEKELDDLKKILDSKEDNERLSHDNLRKLEKLTLNYESQLDTTKSQLQEAEEKVHGLKSALENSYKEVAELHKMNAMKENKIFETTASLETQLKEEIQQAVEKERSLANKKQEALKWELQSVRADLQRMEQQHNLREDVLRKEITDLQQQLRDSEVRNNELSQSISSATRPLLRQIENLQLSHGNQIQLLENAEKNLIERLREAQSQLCELNEKERHTSEQLLDLTQKSKTYEAQIHTFKLDKSKLVAECESLKAKLEVFENEKLQKNAQTDILINSLNKQVESLTKEKKNLDTQLEIEKSRTENDMKKLQALISEYTREKEERKMLKQSEQNQSNTTTSALLSDTVSNTLEPPNSIQSFLKHQQIVPVYDYLRNTGAINILENLQSRLKEKDGEISQLQKNIYDLECIRESLAKELVNLSAKIENLEEKVQFYPELDEKFKKLNSEYGALLTMYGEKEEECEELRLDLQDVKEMYKLQIQDLLTKTGV